MTPIRPILLPLLLLLPGAARADEAALRVAPPPPYAAAPVEPRAPQTSRFAVGRPGAAAPDCQVAFVPAPPRDRQIDQATLNNLAGSPAWQKLERTRLATVYEVLRETTVEQDGVTGLRLVAKLRPQTGVPGDSRAAFTILETPLGRTTTVCAAPAAEFIRREAEFDAVARGVSPPR